MQHTPNDWQDFKLKKEIELLIRSINIGKDISFVLVIDIFVVCVGVLFDKILTILVTNEYPQAIVWGIVLLLLILIPLYKWKSEKLKLYFANFFLSIEEKPSKFYIDSFDNDICFNIMMADSFLNLLKVSCSSDKLKLNFYFSETRFYLNKSIDKLCIMPNLNCIFETNPSLTLATKKVSIARLTNILKLAYHIKEESDTIGNNYIKDEIREQLGFCKDFNTLLDDFISRVCEIFKIKITEIIPNFQNNL